MGVENLQFYSVVEYLVSERLSEVRHEYLGGVIHAMSGASRKHNEVALGIYTRLKAKIKGGALFGLCRSGQTPHHDLPF